MCDFEHSHLLVSFLRMGKLCCEKLFARMQFKLRSGFSARISKQRLIHQLIYLIRFDSLIYLSCWCVLCV